MLFSVAFKFSKKKLVLTFDDVDKLERYCTLARKEFPDLKMHLFNRTKATKPPRGYKPVRGMLWCPYCAEPRRFVKWKKNPKKYNCCEICGILDNDFHVKNSNHLWPTVVLTEDGKVIKRKGRRKKK